MKTFILKTFVILFGIFLLYKATISYEIKKFKHQADIFLEKSNRDQLKNKIINNMEKAIKKENYFNEHERIIISSFIKKILNELELNK